MNEYMKVLLLAAAVVMTSNVQAALPLMTATCESPKGINLASERESDRWKTMPTEVLDPEAGGYVSHPRQTPRSTITINRDGTATETTFLEGGRSMTTEIHLLDNIKVVRANHLPLSPAGSQETPISLVSGDQGAVNLITLYPKQAVVVYASTSYFGIHKGIPVGSVEIARCQLSWEIGG